jgi:hypothetical protein
MSTPLGIEPGSNMAGSNRVDHWISGLCMNVVRLQALYRASPQQPTINCEAGRRTCSERETGTGKLCGIKWDYHIGGKRA